MIAARLIDIGALVVLLAIALMVVGFAFGRVSSFELLGVMPLVAVTGLIWSADRRRKTIAHGEVGR